ncbi:MAG: hypothetical protein JST14_15415 [Bacteroidetes bacterium]|nr:hypothetical protein [Bacteroidota bacterium]
MKKAWAILIITLFAAHSVGFYAWFVLRLSDIHTAAKEQLSLVPFDHLSRLQIPAKSFNREWLSDLEFKWEGKMYDIAKLEMDGDFVIVYALHDADEDELLSLLDTVLRTSQQDQKPVPDAVVQFLSLIFVQPVSEFKLQITFSASRAEYNCRLFCSADRQVVSPPPQQA